MELLIKQWHRRITFIAGPNDYEDARAWLATATRWRGTRLDGMRGWWWRAIFFGTGWLAGGGRITAIKPAFHGDLCQHDLSAYGARLALYRRSMRVPEDISIIGFDDLHSPMYMTPPLTTVRQTLYEVGTCIANIILTMISREGAAVEMLALSLVVRESVRRIT